MWDRPDRLPNPSPAPLPQSIASPKLNLIFSPFNDNPFAQRTNLFLNLGGGFHSNDARVIVQDQTRPLARFWGGELGLENAADGKMEFSAAYWRSYLSSELVFVGDEGTFEPQGASRRHGLKLNFATIFSPG